MKAKILGLATAALLIGGQLALAQQQYDSLGAPTPRPNQGVSPNKVEPNTPTPSTDASKPAARPGETTGASSSAPQSGATAPSGQSVPARPGKGETPGGLTPD